MRSCCAFVDSDREKVQSLFDVLMIMDLVQNVVEQKKIIGYISVGRDRPDGEIKTEITKRASRVRFLTRVYISLGIVNMYYRHRYFMTPCLCDRLDVLKYYITLLTAVRNCIHVIQNHYILLFA